MANDVMQLDILGTCADEPVENVIAFQNDGAGSGDPLADATDLVDTFNADVLPGMLSCLPNDYVALGLKARRLNNGGGPTAILPTAGSTGGRDPANNSAIGPLIDFPYLGSLAWRVGRLFLPGIAGPDATDNRLDPSLIAPLLSFLGDFFPSMTGGANTWNFVIWSRKLLIPYIPLNAQISLKLGVQRRRLTPVL